MSAQDRLGWSSPDVGAVAVAGSSCLRAALMQISMEGCKRIVSHYIHIHEGQMMFKPSQNGIGSTLIPVQTWPVALGLQFDIVCLTKAGSKLYTQCVSP